MSVLLKKVANPLLSIYKFAHDGREQWSYDYISETMARWLLRDQMTEIYSWAIPNQEAIESLVSLGPIVEMGAGKGYWANLVKNAGGDIIAFDIIPSNVWHPVDYALNGVVKNNSHRALFLCWPPYAEPMAYNYARQYKGSTIAVIGEERGCTGNDDFWEYLNDNFTLNKRVVIPQWYTIHDCLTIWKR